MHKRKIAFLAACLLTLVSSAWAEIYHVQVGRLAEEENAQAVAAKLNGTGFGPAVVDSTQTGYRVMTRGFPTYAEANLVKPRVLGAGFAGAFLVSVPEAPPSGGGSQGPAASPVSVAEVSTSAGAELLPVDFLLTTTRERKHPRMPDGELAGIADESADEGSMLTKLRGYWRPSHAGAAVQTANVFVRRFSGSPAVAEVRLRRGYWLIEQKAGARAQAEFESVAAGYGHLPEAGEARLRLGYMKLAQRQPEAALAEFRSVAMGETKAEPEVRLEAMVRHGAMLHRGRDLPAAAAAYEALENEAGAAEMKAFARMQRAGIMLEQAKSGVGSYGDVRAVCLSVGQNYPGANAKVRATAALMALECAVLAQDYEAVETLEQPLVTEFQGTDEALLGVYWMALARHRTGLHAEAAQLLESLTGPNLSTGGRFRLVDLQASARRLAATNYDAMGRPDLAAEMRASMDDLRMTTGTAGQ